MSNPVPGLCPCCKNRNNSDFLQSIHSEGLFKMVEKLAITQYGRDKLGRRYLFCDQCIGWAKTEIMRLREQTQQAGPSQLPGTSQQAGIMQHYGPLQQLSQVQPHYSPVSDPEGSHSTPEPFNMSLYTQENLIGARLANPNESPLHMAILPYFLSTGTRPSELPVLNTNTTSQMFSAPLPSPHDENQQIWNMDNVVEDVGDQTTQEPRENANQPEYIVSSFAL